MSMALPVMGRVGRATNVPSFQASVSQLASDLRKVEWK